MDEIEYKLNTNNSVLVVNAIDKLITSIKSKFKPIERQKFVLENEELKYLRDKCSSKDTVVSLTACQGLLALVEAGVLEIGHTMSTMITLLPSAQNYAAIVSTMSGLLILDLKSRLSPNVQYTCQFSLKSPQHPFITVMEKNSEAIPDVLAQMHALCTHPDYSVSQNSVELLRPVFLWMTCVPRPLSISGVWQLLLSLNAHPQQRELLLECLSWQQIRNPQLLLKSFAAYSLVMDSAVYQQDTQLVLALLPVLARISNQLVLNGLDPRACYVLIARGFALSAPELRPSAGVCVMLLADNLTNSCALYLHELFNLCLNIINKFEVPSIALSSFIALSLQWLNLPSCLTDNALKITAKIIHIHQTTKYNDHKLNIPNLLANKIFKKLIHTDTRLLFTVKILKIWERLQDNTEKLLNWFDSIDKIDINLKSEFITIFQGFLMGNDPEITVKVLKIVLKIVNVKKELSVSLLPVLLYKMAGDTNAVVKMECLKAVPLMAVTKENVPTIVAVLTRLKATKALPTSFLIHLHTTLADVQVRCYPYLQELLVEGLPVRNDDLKWEIELAKAAAVKRICETKASTHGRELVSVISGLLNRCSDASGAAVSATSLDSLAILWSEGVVGPPSTWRALEPKMARDKRPSVLISLCKLLGRIPGLRVATPEYDKLLSDTARRLWHYIAESSHPEVVEAACDALSQYKLEDYTLKDVPDVYRKVVKLPSSYCKTPADAARKPEDVLDYIPCEIWPEVFKNTNQLALDGVTRLVSSLVDREVRGYRSGVYQPDSKTEPMDLSYLPPHSVVRGVMDFLRKSPSFDCPAPILPQLIYAVTREPPRPLPPSQLCFLHELYHHGAHMRLPCLLLAAKQAGTCASGRRFVENYLATLENEGVEESDILMFYELLAHLCRTLQPNSLRQPLEVTLDLGYRRTLGLNPKVTQVKELSFFKQLEVIKGCLDSDKIHEANRTLLSQFIETYFNVIEENNLIARLVQFIHLKLLHKKAEAWCRLVLFQLNYPDNRHDDRCWPQYVNCFTSLATSYIERITSPTSWWEVTSVALRKATDVRCRLATLTTQTAPLMWLNDIIDAAAPNIEDHMYVSERLREPLQTSSLSLHHRDWYLQLMARTQAALVETEKEAEKQFLMSVVMEAAVMMTGHHTLEPAFVLDPLLPLAIHDLFCVRDQEWTRHLPQIIEWLIHSRDGRGVSVAHRCVAQRTLLVLRQHCTHHVWPRALSYTVHDDDD